MEASKPYHVTVEGAHAQSPPANLVAGHVAPTVAQGPNASASKRQGNDVLQGGNPASPAGKARATGAASAARSSGPPAEVRKVSGVKRKKVPTKRPVPSSTPYAPVRCSPTMPFNGVASTPSEVFDEMATSGGSNNATAEFVNLLDTNAIDIDRAPFANFDYNEMEGGVDDHSGEDEVEEVGEGAYEEAQAKKRVISKNYTISEYQFLIRLGVWCLLMLAWVHVKPPRDIGK